MVAWRLARETSAGVAMSASPDSPSWRGYAIGLGAVAVALAFRYGIRDLVGLKVPFLQFYPAIIVAAWYSGFGPALVATAFSALASMYFLLPPAGFAVSDRADQLSLAVFAGTGVFIAWLKHRLDVAEQAQRQAADTATARAERLDAILNTTVDGIIVIDASGTIEAFNRGAQELFGYTEVRGGRAQCPMPMPSRITSSRPVPGQVSRPPATRDHRCRPGNPRADAGRTHFPSPVGRRDANRGRAQIHRNAPRLDEAGPVGGSSAPRGALAGSRRVRGRRDRRDRCARARRRPSSRPPNGCSVSEPEAGAERQHADALAVSRGARHYLARYLATGRAKIIGIGREVQAASARNDVPSAALRR